MITGCEISTRTLLLPHCVKICATCGGVHCCNKCSTSEQFTQVQTTIKLYNCTTFAFFHIHLCWKQTESTLYFLQTVLNASVRDNFAYCIVTESSSSLHLCVYFCSGIVLLHFCSGIVLLYFCGGIVLLHFCGESSWDFPSDPFLPRPTCYTHLIAYLHFSPEYQICLGLIAELTDLQ